MASRPLLSLKGRELIEKFESCNGEPRVLEMLRAELANRSTPGML
jgi:hypothetical protein